MRRIVITTSSFRLGPSLFKFEGLMRNVVKVPKLPEFLGRILIQVIQVEQDFIYSRTLSKPVPCDAHLRQSFRRWATHWRRFLRVDGHYEFWWHHLSPQMIEVKPISFTESSWSEIAYIWAHAAAYGFFMIAEKLIWQPNMPFPTWSVNSLFSVIGHFVRHSQKKN